MNYGTHPLYPYPTRGALTAGAANTAIPGQALTVTSTATVQFQGTTTFNPSTEMVVVDVQGANTYVTFGGETPASGAAHILYVGQNYTWSKATAIAAKFVATTTANCTLYASEFQT